MITREIISYIKSEKEKNTPDTEIVSKLEANGWDRKDIQEAFASFVNPVGSDVPRPPLDSIELKKYRASKKWTIFVILIALSVVYWGQVVFNTRDGAAFLGLGIFIIPFLAVAYFAAYFSVQNTEPFDEKWKEVVDTIARAIGAIVITAVLILGILFATCLFGWA